MVDKNDRCILGFGTFNAMLIVRCMLVCDCQMHVSVCVCVEYNVEHSFNEIKT